jgi:nucleotide-binding universal stress UspA family protein
MSIASHILTSTDFSKASEAGVKRAAEVAKLTGAKVTLIHVFDPSPLAPISTRGFGLSDQLVDEQELEKIIHKELVSMQDTVLSGVQDVEVQVVQGSNAADAITRYATEHDVDLIVLSTHGRTGLSHLLIGSVAENVVRHAKCTVVTVRG